MADTTSNANPTIADMSTSDKSSETVSAAANEDGQNTIDPENEKGVTIGNDVPKPPASPRNAHGFVWALIVTSILMANFLFATDNTIAANIQPAVVKNFASLDKLAWLPIGFFAASWSTNLLWYTINMRKNLGRSY